MGNTKIDSLRFPRMLLGGIACASITVSACDVDLGMRYVQPSRTFGEVVYSEMCERVAYTGELAQLQAGQRTTLDASGVEYRPMCNFYLAPPTDAPSIMQTVATERMTVINDVNTTAPQPLLDPLNNTLQAMLPALDGPSGQNVMTGSGSVLASMAGDPNSAAAIGRLGWRDGFRPPGTEANAVRGLLAVPNLYDGATAALSVLWPSVDGGSDAPGAAERQALMQALGREVTGTTAVAMPGDPNRTMNLALSFLLTEDPGLRTLPAGQSYYAVLRDSRGLAQVNAQGGTLPAPYVDANHDGLADVDADGHFTNSAGVSLPDVTPFPLLDGSVKDNAAGRTADGLALTAANGSTTLFRYLNLDDTVLAGLLRDTPALLDAQRDIPLRLSSGIKLLLGPRQPAHKDYPGQAGLDYTGFDTTQAPLLDLLYSYVQLLGFSNAGDASGTDMARLLRGAWLLLHNQESAMARNLQAVSAAFDTAKQPAYDSAQLVANSTLFDDMAPILVRLLRQPGLLTDLLIAMTDPATADLGPIAAELMSDSGYFFMNDNQLDATQPNAVIGTPGKAVLRDQPDSDVDMNTANTQNNRSVLQRILHLVHDANGLKFCNKNNATVSITILGLPINLVTEPACELFEIDDLATFYLLTMADSSVKDLDPTNNFYNAIQDSVLRGLISTLDTISFGNALPLLTGIPGFGKYPTPQSAGRLLFQNNANRSSFLSATLDLVLPPNPPSCPPQLTAGTLCCNQNHPWQGDHNGVLFALEVFHPSTNANATFFTAFKPIVNAFGKHFECTAYDGQGNCKSQRNAAKILVDLLSVLHRHWPTIKSTFYGLDYEPQSKKSGVSTYEPLIAELLGHGDLWPSTLALTPILLNTVLDDGSNLPVSTLISNFAQWFFDPQSKRLGGMLSFRNGSTMAVRNDGTPTFAPTNDPIIMDVISPAAQGLVTPYDLLSDAYAKKRATLATAQDIETGWKDAVSNLADIYLSAAPGGAPYHFNDPRIRPIELALLSLVRGRVQSHGAAMDLQSWVQGDLYNSIASSLTGPIGASLLDVLDRISADTNAHQKLPALLSAIIADPGPGMPDTPRFRSLLTLTADMLQLFTDDGDLQPLLQKLGPAFGLDNGAVDGALGVTRRSLPADPNQVLLQLGQNLYGADSTGLYPAFRLGKVLNEIDRQNAGQPGVFGSVLSDADYQSIVQTVGQFLSDHQRGGARLVDLVQSRNLAP